MEPKIYLKSWKIDGVRQWYFENAVTHEMIRLRDKRVFDSKKGAMEAAAVFGMKWEDPPPTRKKEELCSSCGSKCNGEYYITGIRKNRKRVRVKYIICKCCYMDICRDFHIARRLADDVKR